MAPWHASSPIDDDSVVFMEVPKTLSDLVDSLDNDLNSKLAARFDTEQVALVISDIEDSTSHGVKLGDLVWTDAVSRHFGQVDRITDVHRGTVIKTMGDGVLIAFDTAADAALAAVAIQRSVNERDDVGHYKIRIGVHVGQAVHSDDDYFGYTVNKTARLASPAAGNEILVSQPIADEIDGLDGLIVGEPRQLNLKGLPGTHTAYPLTRPQRHLWAVCSRDIEQRSDMRAACPLTAHIAGYAWGSEVLWVGLKVVYPPDRVMRNASSGSLGAGVDWDR